MDDWRVVIGCSTQPAKVKPFPIIGHTARHTDICFLGASFRFLLLACVILAAGDIQPNPSPSNVFHADYQPAHDHSYVHHADDCHADHDNVANVANIESIDCDHTYINIGNNATSDCDFVAATGNPVLHKTENGGHGSKKSEDFPFCLKGFKVPVHTCLAFIDETVGSKTQLDVICDELIKVEAPESGQVLKWSTIVTSQSRVTTQILIIYIHCKEKNLNIYLHLQAKTFS